MIQNICSLEDISYGKCERIFSHCAQKEIDSRPPKKVKDMGIDNIAGEKGRKYNTMVYNLEGNSIIATLKNQGRCKRFSPIFGRRIHE